MNQEELIQIIRESFNEAVYPGDDNLIVDMLGDPDGEPFKELLCGRTWQETLTVLEDLKGGDLYFYSSIFSFMTPAAFHYYTPTFLITALRPDTDIVGESFLMDLKPPEPSDRFDNAQKQYRRQRFAELTSLYSDRENRAIALTLRFMEEEEQALESQWAEENKERPDSYHYFRDYWPYWSQWLP